MNEPLTLGTATSEILVLAAIGLFVLLCHTAIRLSLRAARRALGRLRPPLAASRERLRRNPVAALFASRHPRTAAWLAARVSTRRFSGAPLTLLVLFVTQAALLGAALTEEVREAREIQSLDAAVDGLFTPLRTPLPVGMFRWLTDWGQGSTIVAVGLVVSALWAAAGRAAFLLPFWVAMLGSQSMTWAGKFWIARQRPDVWTFVTETSPSFPSGHASAAMAVYGFIAYALWRMAPGVRLRFEALFWGAFVILLIGASRILLGVHYASDVAGGYLVGSLWLAVAIVMAERHARRLGPPQAETAEPS